MKLTIIGRPTGRGVDQDLIRDAIKYYSNLLMIDDLHRLREISVEIHLIPNFLQDQRNTATSGWLDHRQRPDKFWLDMDSNLSYETILISSAHEFTHIKQMAMGERAEGIDGIVRWFGRPFDIEKVHYYDLPWEIEAHGREYGLYDRFVQSLRNEELEPATIIDVSNRLKIA